MRVFHLGPFGIVLMLLAFPIILFISLPIFLALAFLMLVVALARSLSPKNQVKEKDPNTSPVIDNKEIGPYRVRQNPKDPNTIEVL